MEWHSMRPAPIVTTLLSLVALACLLQAQEPPPTAPQGANASFAEGEDVDTPAAGLKGARYVRLTAAMPCLMHPT